MSQQDLVTKQDLDVAVSGLRTEMADIRTEMANLRTEMKGDNAEFRTEMKTDIAELRTEIARGNLKTIVYTATILGFFNAIVFSLITYFTQPRYVPLPGGNQVQESQQVERRIEQPEPRRLKPEQPESGQNQQEGN